jgi:hypothetical protein
MRATVAQRDAGFNHARARGTGGVGEGRTKKGYLVKWASKLWIR